MQPPLSILNFTVISARLRAFTVAGISALAGGWSQMIVEGRRGMRKAERRQDKAPAPSASIANGKPLSAHCFSGRLDGAKRYAVVPALR